MTRVLCLLTMVLWAFVAQAQDFAQHFVSSCNDDTTISCITISPKMFEEIRIRQGLVKDESMREAINDIKSVRIVEARRHCKKHFNKASSQLSRNSNRFEVLPESTDKNIVAVRRRGGNIVEYVTICHIQKKDQQFLIIDITGNDLSSVVKYLNQPKPLRKND